MICDAGLELKKRLFPNNKKRKKNDINIAQLINKSWADQYVATEYEKQFGVSAFHK